MIIISIFIVLFLLSDFFILGLARNRTLIKCAILQAVLLLFIMGAVWHLFPWREGIFIGGWILCIKILLLPFLAFRTLHDADSINQDVPAPITMILGPIFSRLLGVLAFIVILALCRLYTAQSLAGSPPISVEVAFFTLFSAGFLFLTRPMATSQIVALHLFSNGLFLLAFLVCMNKTISFYPLIFLDILNIVITGAIIYFKIEILHTERSPGSEVRKGVRP